MLRIGLAALLALGCVGCFKDSGGASPPAGSTSAGATGDATSTTGDISPSSNPTPATGSGPVTPTSDASTTAPGAGGWRLPLMVESGDLAEPLRDVPVLVVLTPERFDYASADPEGGDVRFVLDLDAEFGLPHEVEQWDPEGVSLLWVRLPVLGDGPGPGPVWLVYGDTPILPWSNPADVWSNQYAAVWHFVPGPEDDFADSTMNENTMSRDSDDTNYSLELGPNDVGSALTLDESSRMRVEDDPSLGLPARWTIAAWVRPVTTGAAVEHRRVLDKSGSYRFVSTSSTASRAFINLTTPPPDPMQFTATSDNPLPESAWTYLVGTRDNVGLKIYVDAVQSNGVPVRVDAAANANALHVGETFAGRIDELRISTAVRSPTWIGFQRRTMLDEVIGYGAAEPFE